MCNGRVLVGAATFPCSSPGSSVPDIVLRCCDPILLGVFHVMYIVCRTESFLDFMLQGFIELPLEPFLPPWLPRLPGDMSDSDGWPSFLPTSRRLDFNVFMSATAADFSPRPSCASVLRLAMMVVAWLASLPKMCFAIASLLAFTAAGILILHLNKLMRPRGGKPSKLTLQMKAFLCALMLICQQFQVLSHQAWLFFDQLVEVQEGAGSIPTTITESAFEPSWVNVLGPLVAGPLDECGNPMHNNMIDISPLLESPGEVLVVSAEGGLMHVKVPAVPILTESAVSTQNDAAPQPAQSQRSVIPNAGDGQCFWLSVADILGSPGSARAQTASWLRSHPDHPSHISAAAVEQGCYVNGWQVNATVQAHPNAFTAGLLVFHVPSALLVHYRVGSQPAAWRMDSNPYNPFQCLCLVYTQPASTSVGHFERMLCSDDGFWLGRDTAEAWNPLFEDTVLDCRSMPHMLGGGPPSQTPQPRNPDEMLAALLSFDVPMHVAQAAASMFPNDINAALDWACSSDRRHSMSRSAAPSSPVNLTTPPRERPGASASGHVCREAPAIPFSWQSPMAHPADPPLESDSSVPAGLATMTQRAANFWAEYRACAEQQAHTLYMQELDAASTMSKSLHERLVEGFLSLPVKSPCNHTDHGLSVEDLYTEELRLLNLRTAELRNSKHGIADACAAPLDVIGLCPYPLAVACILGSAADIAPEFIFAFFYSLIGWTCHHNLRAVFDPIKSDRRTRPRCVIQAICDSAAGKSPFWRGFVSPWFTGIDGESSVFQSHRGLWASGGQKGLHVAQATDADLAQRMMESGGRMFWASPECWLMLDTSHAKRSSDASKEKVNFHYLLECQNGNDYGPRSIKSCPQQIHIPTTNFGMLLLGQADAVRDFWGQVFRVGSPVRGKGFEGRPLFLFAGAARLCHQDQQISAEIIYVLKCILLNVARAVGHASKIDFMRNPLRPHQPLFWKDLQRAASDAEADGPPCSQVAAAKWGYSCGSHIIANHLFLSSFESLPRRAQDVQILLEGGQTDVVVEGSQGAAANWGSISNQAFLAGPRLLSHTMSSLHVIFSEMSLPAAERAGSQAIALPPAGHVSHVDGGIVVKLCCQKLSADTNTSSISQCQT